MFRLAVMVWLLKFNHNKKKQTTRHSCYSSIWRPRRAKDPSLLDYISGFRSKTSNWKLSLLPWFMYLYKTIKIHIYLCFGSYFLHDLVPISVQRSLLSQSPKMCIIKKVYKLYRASSLIIWQFCIRRVHSNYRVRWNSLENT